MPKNLLMMLANLKINNTQLQIENGTIDGLATDETVELDANQILGLFVSLFGIQTAQTSPTGGVTGKGDRITSIDSETSMDLDRKNTASPLDISHLPHNGNVSTSSAAKLDEVARDRGNSGVDINSDTHKTRSGTIDISRLPSNGSTVTFETLSTSLTGENGGVSHVFTNIQQQQQQQQPVPMPAQNTPRITFGTGPEMDQGLLTSKSPKAAGKLVEALSKLRQVNLILWLISYLLILCVLCRLI